MAIKHAGRCPYRFKDNPREKVFADAWRKINEVDAPQRYGTLDYMLAEDNNRPCGEVTQRDAEVAATVIQWLGSPVGQRWLAETQAKAEKKNP